jgi:3-oxoacyl-(acyl-carrier-protein) synthase
MLERVVVTGMGVIAPGASGVPEFEVALREGRSGIRFWPEAAELGLGCQVGGIPAIDSKLLDDLLPPPRRRVLSPIMEYAALAAIECWRDSGLPFDFEPSGRVDWDTGCVVGTGIGAIDILTGVVAPLVAQRQHRKMGSRMVERVMISGSSASVAGILGLGGPAITVSSACSSATCAIHRAAQTVRMGLCKRILAGGVEIPSLHTAATFDSMHVVPRDFNQEPEKASRPLSATAGGFVPSGGSGFLMLEALESARERDARIYAELAGSYENSGGQRGDGSMTAASSEGAIRCIRGATADAGVPSADIDYVNGHLTGTTGDPREIQHLATALGRRLTELPWVNATKSLTGHALGAAGAIESIATVLQLNGGFLHPSANCRDLHPEIEDIAGRVPMRTVPCQFNIALKTSFGFGDVNACLIFRRYEANH